MNNNTADHTESTTDPGRPPLFAVYELPEMHPLLRVYTLGPLTLEWVGTPTPFPPERLQSRGAAPALVLLKALISRPHRCATHDWLREHLRDAEEEAMTSARLEDLASLLRGLLCPPIEDKASRDRLRLRLLTRVYGSSESGPGCRLGGYPLIWVDIDALSWSVEQACRLERFGEDALPLWERAYALARRGEYLVEEPYSDWAEPRRAEAARYLRQSVHALSRRYLSQEDARGEEEVLRLLGDYWQQHVEDEDALRPLMELLGKRERYQEALGYYEQLCDVLEEEGRTPDARTTDLKEFLCAKQLQRSLPRAQVSERVLPVRVQGHAEWPASPAPMPLPHGTRAVILPSQALDLLSAAPNAFPDTQDLGAWLALGTGDLTVLFDVGWTTEDVLDALRVTLQAVQDMPQIARQQFLRLSSAALMKDIALPASETLSQQEQTRLYVSLGQSIAESWKLFHTSKPSLMLIIAQAQLTLVERLHVLLHPTTRPFFYAALYRLIGASLYLFGSFEQAQHALEQSYLAGLQTANAWHMAQSLSWQAYLWHARGEPSHALDTIEQALRLISFRDDLECLRLRARLLALGAEYLALVGDASGAHERLGASQALLSALSEPHEEFDTTSWLQQAGICALHLRDYSLAIQRLERAFDQLPSQWRLRSLATAIPLAKALTRAKKAGRAIEVAQRVIPLVTSVGASVLTQQFVTYLEQDLLAHFPDDKRCQTLVIEARQQLERHSASH